MDRFHEAGITVIPVVPSVALSKTDGKLGADAVIAEGMEAGGHIGKLTTMTLVRQVVEAVSIPVIGAGGVADGAGAAAVFMLEQMLFRWEHDLWLLKNQMLTKTLRIKS